MERACAVTSVKKNVPCVVERVAAPPVCETAAKCPEPDLRGKDPAWLVRFNRSADRAFRRKYSMRGRAVPRSNLSAERNVTDELDDLNFGRATPPPPVSWRVEYRAETLPTRAFVVDLYAYEGGSGVFLSRVERNRLVHSRNGNTTARTARGRGARGRGTSAPAANVSASNVTVPESLTRLSRSSSLPVLEGRARGRGSQRGTGRGRTASTESVVLAPAVLEVREDLCLARVWAPVMVRNVRVGVWSPRTFVRSIVPDSRMVVWTTKSCCRPKPVVLRCTPSGCGGVWPVVVGTRVCRCLPRHVS